jgi:putative ABC transport system permease protein
VRDVSVTSNVPLTDLDIELSFQIEGRAPYKPGEEATADYTVVGNDYFRTMNIALRRGRVFTSQDNANSPQALVVSDAFVQRYFPNEDPIGRRIVFDGEEKIPREIVGVVGDVRQEGLRRPAAPQVYEAFAQKPSPAFRIAVRSAGDPARFAETLRQQVFAVDRNQPVSDVRTLEDVIGVTTTRDRLSAGLLGVFAAVAVTLAAIGIYGVIAYSVAERTQEIGVRLALGANRARILRLILGQTLHLVVYGLALGLLASAATSKLLRSLLYDVSPNDPATWVLASIVLITVAFAAGLVPALRALRIHPMAALRAE